ncbi:ABC transporter substrate-binding protein [Betaproteobacteria bacterium GR16-43]|nr:ABC transporter substrate-binding protein [Betaproteobacteria bacterium GR16-43]
MKSWSSPWLLALSLALFAPRVLAQEPIRIGFLAPYSGPFAEYGALGEGGIKAFLKLNGDSVAGRKIEVIVKDTAASPEVAKRLAQEMVVRDKVDLFIVTGFTPETLTVAMVATEARKPLFATLASSSGITARSPFMIRTASSFAQTTVPLAAWLAKSGVKRAATLVSDYNPGIDAENAFKSGFTAAGGQVSESIRVPLRGPEFSPFVQRLKDAKAEAVFAFVPAGEQGVGLTKALLERGIIPGAKFASVGELMDDHVFNSLGDAVIGSISSGNYSVAHDSAENRAFVKAFAEVTQAKGRPTFMAVHTFDAMAAVFAVARTSNGSMDGEKFMEAVKGLKLTSPRGPITIDAQTRDIVQTVYIRRVEKVSGRLENVEFEKFEDIKETGSR